MNDLKLKLIDELIEHLSSLRGKDLKSMLDEEKMPAPLEGEVIPKELEIEEDDGGVPVSDSEIPESVTVEGEDLDLEEKTALPGGKEEEMTDEELEELLKKSLK